MCGLTGLVSFSSSDKIPERLNEMTSCISHRGPDGDGYWVDPKDGIGLGHRRLAIIDLSEAGHQPMWSPSKRYVMVYNGEIYNYLDLKAEFENDGHIFKGHSDTEVMLAAFEKYGIRQTLEKLSGMFVIAVYDTKSKKLTLARDYLGKKPLYYGWSGNDFLFGSELKALKSHPEFEKNKINQDVVALYMRYACVPAPYCIFKNINQLMPGSMIEVSLDDLKGHPDVSLRAEKFWSATEIVKEGANSRKLQHDEQTVISEFSSLLETCVKERMISDVPLGAFLSGGIDSSAIVAFMQKVATSPVKTFSVGFDVDGFNEAEFAKTVAKHLGTDHHEIYLKPKDALEVIPKLPLIYDEPFADISQIPTYLVSKFAREHVTVALSGDGGDELLGGYRRHFMIPPMWSKINKVPDFMRGALSSGISIIGTGNWSRIGNLTSRKHLGDTMAKLSDLMRQNNSSEVHDFLLGFWENPYNVVPDAQPLYLDYKDQENIPEGLSFAEEMMWRDSISYLPNDILVKVDRASMAVSLEARAPLLDRRLYEYVWGLPEHFKVRNGKGKWLLREVLSQHVPKEMFERPKKGFSPPLGPWLSGELKDWAEELLKSSSLEEAGLNSKPIRDAWDEHLKGHRNLSTKLWTVLMYQSWRSIGV